MLLLLLLPPPPSRPLRQTTGPKLALLLLLQALAVLLTAAPPASAQCTTGCVAGQYYDTGSASCLDCLAGSYVCAPGYYADTVGSVSCTACPANYECSDPATAPAACGAGNYSAGLAVECSPCPAGFACVSAGIGPVSCHNGSYALEGSSRCSSCDAGHSCADAASAPVPCAPGTASAGGEQMCTACTAGTYANYTGAATCAACPAGHSCGNPALDPVQCAAGYASTGGAAGCSACASGTYANTIGSRTCELCTAGHHCWDPAVDPVECDEGFYSPGGLVTNCSACSPGTHSSPSKHACEACSAGYQCVSPSLGEVLCPNGTHSNASATGCTVCPIGKRCPQPWLQPQSCPVGTYNGDLGQTECQPCPKGYECSTDPTTPVLCADGEYSDEGDATCQTCSAGYRCPTPAQDPIACAAGTYSLAGWVNCTTCPAGSACASTDATPQACASGEYSQAGSVACAACPAGYECSDPSALPIACTAGTYSLGGVVTGCSTCPAGSSCGNTTSSPVACQAGYYSLAEATTCTPCPAGFACALTTSDAKTACAAGTYSAGAQDTCTPCPSGKACPSTELAIEIDCADGTFSTGSQDSCTSCPAGEACSGNVRTACSLGTFSTGGATSCTSCPAGFACPYTNSSTMSECAPGSYSIADQHDCTACPAGFECPDIYTATETACAAGYYALGSATQCTPCPSGFACPDADTIATMITCATGTYTIASAPQTSCQPCPAGHSCPRTDEDPQVCTPGTYSLASVANCTTCPAGYECSNPAIAPQICTGNTYSLQGATECRYCDAGYACSDGATEAAPVADACPAGYYCPFGVATAQVCPAGYYANRTGGTSEFDTCVSCIAGYYCVSGTVDPETAGNLCPLGYYCPTRTEFATQFPCPAGTKGAALGGTSKATACPACPAGEFCEEGFATGDYDNACLPGFYCPAGTKAANEFPCPGGTYSAGAGNIVEANCTACPVGNYCPQGSQQPTVCPVGTYNPSLSAALLENCLECEAGRACPNTGSHNSTDACAEGHFCPNGTAFANSNPCPPGTYGPSTSLASEADCTICPAGSACDWGTTSVSGSNPPQDCAVGHACPEGTGSPDQYPCPPGYYTTATNLTLLSSCSICPAGSHCVGGQGFVSGACAAGHYCPQGTNSSTRYPCAAGKHSNGLTNLTAPGDCITCPTGAYCEEGSSDPEPCPAGTYNNVSTSGALSLSDCLTCPGGQKCTAGTVDPVACLGGEYSASGASSCLPCAAGHYCDAAATSSTVMYASKRCQAGVFCPDGTSVADPTSANPTFACPTSKYCEEATPLPVNCPAGTYGPTTGLTSDADCTICPAGSYCVEGSDAITGPCALGYFCEEGSSGSQQRPCSAGLYRNLTGARNETECSDCPAGSYCPRGTGDPLECPLGYHCPLGSAAPVPCPIGTFGATKNLLNETQCTDCTPGSYCDTLGLSAPVALCDPGFYCASRATTSAPADLSEGGGPCPRGGYCEAGSFEGEPCPPGTFNNVTGSRSPIDCEACPAGYYCRDSASPGPTGPCDAGYYCTGSATTAQQYVTPAGYYTPSAASAPIACEAGTYNPRTNASVCPACPEGFVCPNQTTIYYQDCPAGSYCPLGTHTPVPCPRGTFSPRTNMGNVSQCEECTAGMYCQTNGLTAPSGNCSAGFYCSGGSDVARPVLTTAGDNCPAGYYCPEGSSSPFPCGAGTYQPAANGESEADCISCTPGYHCNTSALTTDEGTGLCDAGFYCPLGSTTSTQVVCPTGHSCPTGSSEPQPCELGQFANVTGLDACLDCPARFFCFGTNVSSPEVCPEGQYCGAGSSAPADCPIGTFSNRTGLELESECETCTAGQFCDSLARTQPNGPCAAGYYCEAGSVTQYGRPADASVSQRICPAGNYCPGGSASPRACPAGTFTPSTGLMAESECPNCTAGYYCAATAEGLSAPTGKCDEGYFCASGSAVSAPAEGACPAGSFCVAGAVAPEGCTAGTYQPNTARGSCDVCPSGYYCPANTTDFAAYPCPSGYACPNGTRFATEFSCPQGTFSSLTQRTSLDDCEPCLEGQFCNDTGLSAPVGDCAAGWFCVSGSTSAQPANGQCPVGSFCPVGSSNASLCTAGYACPSTQLPAPPSLCQAGYYCEAGSTSTAPATGVCPAGYYCEEGSSAPEPCPLGEYAPVLGAMNASECIACPSGRFCNTTGIGSFAATAACPAGFYCPNGTVVPELLCTQGHYCAGGDDAPVACPAGSYQDDVGQSRCLACPARYFCEGAGNTDFASSPCPAGYACPENSTSAFANPCPVSTFSNRSRLASTAECDSCPPRYYCFSAGISEPTALCTAGFSCNGGVQVPEDACPAGGYCPTGTAVPIPCPAGTIASAPGATNISSCLPCPTGRFCATSGATAVNASSECDAGFLCILGASVARPSDGVTGRPCRAGTKCAQGAVGEVLCSEGTFNPNTAQSECVNCTEGFYCPHQGMANATACPAGFYCPENSVTPTPCPPSTYSSRINLVSRSECLSCPIGQYCDSLNLTAPSGDCAEGYYCGRGQLSPTPEANGTSGPCPAGHWCAAGTLSPTACDAGTFNPSTGSNNVSDCLPCSAGSFCDVEGLDAPTGECDGGYYCLSGSTTAQEVPCPEGHSCPVGSVSPQGCDDGEYQDLPEQTSCKTCPEGFACRDNATSPVQCGLGTYCPEGSAFARSCPLGTYGATAGLAASEQCSSCPAGSYCVDGMVTGSCTAGYLCLGGSSSPTPPASPCPAGHWCGAGATVAVPCQNGTYRSAVGGARESDCLECEAGQLCIEGQPTPTPCPAGYYCEGAGLVATYGPRACPLYTYSPLTGRSNVSSCEPCPSGFLCDQITGASAFSPFPCPEGGWCDDGATQLVPCSSGTYRNETSGSSVSDCIACTAGHYCRTGAVVPEACPGGNYCPLGATEPLMCPAGTVCAPLSTEPLDCPAGFYCGVNTTTPLPCLAGTYCPGNSTEPIACPLGTFSPSGLALRTTRALSCIRCAQGLYQDDPSQNACEQCSAGYLCTGGASTPTPRNSSYGGLPCPEGHYCGVGAERAVPCGRGTYNPSPGANSSDACLLCPKNTFNNDTGRAGCYPCASSSRSSPGATSCKCIGRNRAFQASDRSCICEPGFQFFDDGLKLSEEDSSQDCEPRVYDRCTGSTSRDISGNCVSRSGGDCDQKCGGGKGRFIVTLGVCDCRDTPDLDDVCDASCRATAPTYTFIPAADDPDHPGFMIVNGSDGVLTVTDLSAIEGFAGDFSCSDEVNGCPFVNILTGEGLAGAYGTPAGSFLGTERGVDEESLIVSRLNRKLGASRSTTGAFHTQALDEASQSGEVINPAIICLQLGESLVFDLTTGEDSYPIYLKDNLLNTNPNFDYGPFRELGRRNRSALELFAFTFSDAGVYVFSDNANRAQETVVAVMRAETVCPTEGRIVPMTSANLIALGVVKNDDLILSPNWILVAIMASLIVAVMGAVLFAVWRCKRSGWSAGLSREPSYRAKAANDRLDVWSFETKGSIPKVDRITNGPQSMSQMVLRAGDDGDDGDDGAGGGDVDLEKGEQHRGGGGSGEKNLNPDNLNELKSDIDMEGFDFHSLYKKLEETRDAVKEHFRAQDSDMQSFYEHVSRETDYLKSVMGVKMHIQLQTTGEGFTSALRRLMIGEISARDTHMMLQKRREVDFQKLLEDIRSEIRTMRSADIFPVRQLIRQACDNADFITRAVSQERKRRRAFGANLEIVGDNVIQALADADFEESKVENRFLEALHDFKRKVGDDTEDAITSRVRETQRAYRARLESLEESGSLTKHQAQLEELDHQSKMLNLAMDYDRETQALMYTLQDVYFDLGDLERKYAKTMRRVQKLVHRRKLELQRKDEGHLFRGINPDLAKVLAGLLGQRGGVQLDPSSGTYVAMPDTYDPTELFEDDGVDVDKEAEDADAAGHSDKRYIVDDLFGDDGSLGGRRGGGDTGGAGDTTGIFFQAPVVEVEGDEQKEDEGDDYEEDDGDVPDDGEGGRKPRDELDDADDGGAAKEDLQSFEKHVKEVTLQRREDANLKFIEQAKAIDNDPSLSAEQKAEAKKKLEQRQKAVQDVLDREEKAHVAGTKALLQHQVRANKNEQSLVTASAAALAQQMARIRQLEEESRREEERRRREEEAYEKQLQDEQTAILEHLERSTGTHGDDDAGSAGLQGNLLNETEIETLVSMHKSGETNKDNLAQMREKMRQKRKQATERRREAKARRIEAEKERAADMQKKLNKAKVLATITSTFTKGGAASAMVRAREAAARAFAKKTGGAGGGADGGAGAEEDVQAAAGAAAGAGAGAAAGGSVDAGIQEVEARIQATEEEFAAEEAVMLKKMEEQKAKHHAKIEAEAAQKLEAYKKKLEAKMQRDVEAAESVEDEQAREQQLQAIMAEHKQKLELAESQMNLNLEKKRVELEERLAKRRKEKRAKLLEEKERRMARDLQVQRELKANEQVTSELGMVKAALAEFEDPRERREAAKEVIERVLRPRFRKDVTALLRQQYEQRAAVIEEVLLADEAAAGAAGGMSGEGSAEDSAAYAEQMAAARLDMPQADEQRQLRTKQQQEVRTMYKQLYPDEDFAGAEWQEPVAGVPSASGGGGGSASAADADSGMESFIRERERRLGEERRKVEREMEERLRKREDERIKLQKRLEEEDARMEQQFQVELERMVSSADERARLKNEDLLMQKKKLFQKQMEERKHLDDEQRQVILEQYKSEMRALEDALNADRERQLHRLRLQIVRRQQVRKQVEMERKKLELRRINALKRKERLEKLRQAAKASGDAPSLTEEEVARLEQEAGLGVLKDVDPELLQALAKGGKLVSPEDVQVKRVVLQWQSYRRTGEPAGAEEPAAEPAVEEAEIDPGSVSIFKKLLKVEKMVATLAGTNAELRDTQYYDAEDSGVFAELAAADAADAAERMGGNGEDALPAVCDADAITPSQYVLYRFGVSLIKQLHGRELGRESEAPVEPIKLLLAESLPPSPHQRSAFRNSFFYDRARRTLFVRQQRLDKAGDFVLLLVHTLAHIGSGQWDDRHVDFVREFYACLRVVCEDVFRSSSGSSGASSMPVGRLARGEAVNDYVRLQTERMRTKDPLATHHLLNRLDFYSLFSASQTLRDYLRTEVEDPEERGDVEAEIEEIDRHEWDLVQGCGPVLPSLADLQANGAEFRDDDILVTELGELDSQADVLNEELVAVVSKMYRLEQHLKSLEGGIGGAGAGVNAAGARLARRVKDDLGYDGPGFDFEDAALARVELKRLAEEKDRLVHALQQISDHIDDRVHGVQDE